MVKIQNSTSSYSNVNAGNIKTSDLSAGKATVNGTSTLKGAVTAESTLAVTGAYPITGGFLVSTAQVFATDPSTYSGKTLKKVTGYINGGTNGGPSIADEDNLSLYLDAAISTSTTSSTTKFLSTAATNNVVLPDNAEIIGVSIYESAAGAALLDMSCGYTVLDDTKNMNTGTSATASKQFVAVTEVAKITTAGAFVGFSNVPPAIASAADNVNPTTVDASAGTSTNAGVHVNFVNPSTADANAVDAGQYIKVDVYYV